MAQAEIHEVISVDKDKFFETVTRYENYPQFVDGVHSVKVERKGPGKARVSYQMEMMGQEIQYVLDHVEDAAAGTVEWTLVESNFMKKNVGRWDIKAAGAGKADVRYALEIEFKVPVPGFILNRVVKGRLPQMLKEFEKQVGKK
jgi:ribosome-associated toxin RatA of RatAB toxin-antitoxin module